MNGCEKSAVRHQTTSKTKGLWTSCTEITNTGVNLIVTLYQTVHKLITTINKTRIVYHIQTHYVCRVQWLRGVESWTSNKNNSSIPFQTISNFLKLIRFLNMVNLTMEHSIYLMINHCRWKDFNSKGKETGLLPTNAGRSTIKEIAFSD